MRRPAYAVSWERTPRRCTGCGRFVSEAGTVGYDRRARLRWCERCLFSRETRLAAWRVDVEPERRAA